MKRNTFNHGAFLALSLKVLTVAWALHATGVCPAGESAAESEIRSMERLEREYRQPVHDPHMGRLDEKVIGLLEAARSLSAREEERLRTGRVEERPADDEVDPPGEGLEIVPAGSRRDRGYAYLKTGRYGKAAALYRDILESEPEDRHAILMLAFCLRRKGEREKAGGMMNRLKELEGGKGDVAGAEWLSGIDAMLDDFNGN